LGSITGDGIAIPHIKSLTVIGEFGAIMDDVLRHLPLFIAWSVETEELLVRFVEDIPAIRREVGYS